MEGRREGKKSKGPRPKGSETVSTQLGKFWHTNPQRRELRSSARSVAAPREATTKQSLTNEWSPKREIWVRSRLTLKFERPIAPDWIHPGRERCSTRPLMRLPAHGNLIKKRLENFFLDVGFLSSSIRKVFSPTGNFGKKGREILQRRENTRKRRC